MIRIQFNPLPELETERLLLRPLVMSDAQAMFELRSDPQIMQYIPRVLPTNVEEAREHLQLVVEGVTKNEYWNWGICIKGQSKVIGTIGFYRIKFEHYRGEIGYLLHKAYHQQGLMHEAVQKLIQFGFEQIGFHTIEAVISPENIASKQLLIKNNFIKEAYFKENEFWQGKFLDSEVYTLFSPLPFQA